MNGSAAHVWDIRASRSLALPDGVSEQAALENVLDELAPVFRGGATAEGERAAPLLVLTENAGSATAVQFWRDALSVGLGVASPAAFPWCLANAPCATIARRFSVTGPNITWLARLADARAFDAPAAWLVDFFADGSVAEQQRHAWLIALHFGKPAARLVAWHLAAVEVAGAANRKPATLVEELSGGLAQDWATSPALTT